MRIAQPLFITVALALMTGCFLVPEVNHSNERAVCERYLDCVTAVTPEAAGAAVVLYGEDSACWASSTDAERCAVACEEALDDVVEASPREAQCLPEGETLPDLSLTDEPMEWMLFLEENTEVGCALSQSGSPEEQLYATEPTGVDSFDLEFDTWWLLLRELYCTTDGYSFTCSQFRDVDPVSLWGTVEPNMSEMTLVWPVNFNGHDCEYRFSGERQ